MKNLKKSNPNYLYSIIKCNRIHRQINHVQTTGLKLLQHRSSTDAKSLAGLHETKIFVKKTNINTTIILKLINSVLNYIA